MKKQILSLMAMAVAGTSYGQLYITDVHFDPSSVTNEGIVVGTTYQNDPFSFWNPFENTLTEVGGVSAGNGIGGTARFTDDGKHLFAPMHSDKIPVSTSWNSLSYPALADYIFNDIIYVNDMTIWAVGSSADGNKGTAIRSYNHGASWKEACVNATVGAVDFTLGGGMVSVAAIDPYNILIGGHNGKIFVSANSYDGFKEIDVHPSSDKTEVATYWAMDFMGLSDGQATDNIKGCIGLEATDGSYAVWYTSDSGNSFDVATGVEGIPQYITHVGETFYMVTKNGHVQLSVDYGKTWTDMFNTLNGEPLYRIRFADENKGIATSDEVVYLTTDGGETWTKTGVLPQVTPFADTDVVWNDATWVGDVITVVGNGGLAYQSEDNGETFRPVRYDNDATANITAMYYDESGSYNLLANGLKTYHKEMVTETSGYCAGDYDIENDTWTPMKSLGYDIQTVISSPWGVSGDGKTVVGLINNLYPGTNGVQGHACVWNDEFGVIDLGSKFADRNKVSRANAVSYDGSKIVGWQDIWGQWHGCYWTKQDDGTYKQTMMTKEGVAPKDVDYTDAYDCYEKLPGYCYCISSDGNWIGGSGKDATCAYNGPWIWNETEGYIQIDDSEGCVLDLSADGSVAVGRTGFSGWIWTKEEGLKYLQNVADEMGCDMGIFICTGYDLSANGRYVTGYGVIGEETYGYVLDLQGNVSAIDNKTLSQVKASIYPNPVADELHVALPFNAEEMATTLTLVDMQGRVVRTVNRAAQDNVINVSNLTAGCYILDVNAAGTHKSFKVVVKH